MSGFLEEGMKFFIWMIVTDSFLAAMYYLWQVEGMEQAGYVFMFMIWFCGIAGLLTLCLVRYIKPKDQPAKLAIHDPISNLFSILFLIGTVWAGHIVAGALYLVSGMSVRAMNSKSKDMEAKG